MKHYKYKINISCISCNFKDSISVRTEKSIWNRRKCPKCEKILDIDNFERICTKRKKYIKRYEK